VKCIAMYFKKFWKKGAFIAEYLKKFQKKGGIKRCYYQKKIWLFAKMWKKWLGYPLPLNQQKVEDVFTVGTLENLIWKSKTAAGVLRIMKSFYFETAKKLHGMDKFLVEKINKRLIL